MNKVIEIFKKTINIPINNIFMQAGLIICLLGAFITVSLASYAENVVKNLADNLIRFHVVANSDSADDQQLKMIIRDRIIQYMNSKLENSKDIEQTKNIIVDNIIEIKAIAEEEVIRAGKQYKVEASLGKFPFPTKAYGDVTLPAGKYEALQIVLGEGLGMNWWCVLFPPLCFVDATHGVIPENFKDELKNELSAEDYNIITTASNQGDVPIRIKFKIVEIYHQSQIKIAGAFNKLVMMIR